MSPRPIQGKPQHALLKAHFADRDSISGMEAQALYRIRSLSRRINDLEREHGMIFRRERRQDPTGQWYVRYVRVHAA